VAKSKQQKRQEALERLTADIADRLSKSQAPTFSQRMEYNTLKKALGLEGGITISEPRISADYGSLKRTLLNSNAGMCFKYTVGPHWFVETSFGNFHWSDGASGGDDTLRLFRGDLVEFCKRMRFPSSAQSANPEFHTIKEFCGETFRLLV
jgi:hypothetical protein